ncbi:hypothetical protein Q2K19_17875 [Micromonospora soli]|uniref:hypothetical protein n=1 Tax=Micromonospora sp. NBRC 110009 TaxID=3061627 RepID=UPI002671167E|nr:hypothetical protein [Micromonospora sp. NBRC 110009]WKT96103.1 hypothetical protein Q2K19_17875 [Micromonospora sp. NBRC 110009]
MDAYHQAARPARLLAALAVGAAVAGALTTGRRGRLSRAAAATAAGALVGRRLAGALAPPTGRSGDGVGPGRAAQDGPDELRLWVAAGDLPVPAARPLSS